jgi:hypothetical protein
MGDHDSADAMMPNGKKTISAFSGDIKNQRTDRHTAHTLTDDRDARR